jgi:hypothetical protein
MVGEGLGEVDKWLVVEVELGVAGRKFQVGFDTVAGTAGNMVAVLAADIVAVDIAVGVVVDIVVDIVVVFVAAVDGAHAHLSTCVDVLERNTK